MAGPSRNTFINLLLLLRAVRWYNLALMLISQYLVALYVFGAKQDFYAWIGDYRLHIIAFSTSLSLAGAFLINGFYDLDKDLVNQPARVLVYKTLGQDFLLNVYAVITIAAILLGLAASIKIFIFVSVLVFMFWFYSHKLQKLPLVREITATLLAIAPLAAIWLHYGTMHKGFLVYLISLAIVGFTREVVKDLEGNKGNIIFGYQTVVVAAGQKFAKQWLVAVNLFLAAGFLVGFSIFVREWNYFTAISGFSIISTVLVSLACLVSSSRNLYSVADTLLKVTIVVHLVSLVLADKVLF
jgi:4-hydroxybenzoate polyprenyltransferase